MWKNALMGGLLASLLGTAALACDDGKCPISGLHFDDGWVRAAGPAARTAAVYGEIENHGDHPVVLTGVTTPAATHAQFHRSMLVDGVMRMRGVSEGISLPPHGEFSWRPGGNHIMLMGLTAPLAEGDIVPLRFTLADGAVLEVSARVGEARAGSDDHHSAHDARQEHSAHDAHPEQSAHDARPEQSAHDTQPESHHQDRHDAGTHNEDGHEMMHHSEDHSTHH